MKTSQEKIKVGKEISSRFFIAMEYILNNYSKYKVENMKQFAASIGLLQSNLIAIREEENRTVTLYNIHKLVLKYDISADWLLTGRSVMVSVNNDQINDLEAAVRNLSEEIEEVKKKVKK